MDYKKTASHKQMLKNNALMMKMDLDRRNSIKIILGQDQENTQEVGQ